MTLKVHCAACCHGLTVPALTIGWVPRLEAHAYFGVRPWHADSSWPLKGFFWEDGFKWQDMDLVLCFQLCQPAGTRHTKFSLQATLLCSPARSVLLVFLIVKKKGGLYRPLTIFVSRDASLSSQGRKSKCKKGGQLTHKRVHGTRSGRKAGQHVPKDHPVEH